MSYDDTNFIGGIIVSYKQKEKINQDLKAFEMSLKHKKRKRKQKAKPIPMNDIGKNIGYTHLLNRIFNEPHLRRKNLPIPAPDVRAAGTKKTCYVNIIGTCQALKRDPNHLKKFIETELITTSNFNGDKQLIIRGRWRDQHIRSVLTSYVKSYILCEDCKSLNTKIEKNNSTRLYELKCNDCGAERTCKRIEKAFKTIANKGQRIKLREREREKKQKRGNGDDNDTNQIE